MTGARLFLAISVAVFVATVAAGVATRPAAAAAQPLPTGFECEETIVPGGCFQQFT